METWKRLYAMVWIALVEFLLVMTPASDRTTLVVAHVGLGIAIVALAFVNFSDLRGTRVPGRVKRIAKSTFTLAVVAGVLGVLLGLGVGQAWTFPLVGITVYGLLEFVHVINAFAIITQAAATAIGYDMWEEREFERESEPGQVPEHPSVAAKHAATANP